MTEPTGTNASGAASTDRLWQSLKLPEQAVLNSRVYKKQLLEAAELSAHDKKIVNEDVDSLIWRHTLKPQTIQIPGLQTDHLDYPEIAVIEVSLKSPKRAKRLVELLQRNIPYPLLLVLTHDHTLWVSLANKRQSLADSDKLTVEDFFDTGWLQANALSPEEEAFFSSLDSRHYDWTNLYTFYQALVSRVIALQAARLTGQFQLDTSADKDRGTTKKDRPALLRDIKALEEKLTSLTAELKKETQFNRRLELNISIKQCQQEIANLTQYL
ncbi:hypothetical protein Q668_00255 [Alcanivorax sp. PN-3]|nr:hypothetical protein Q668_00255 [Alcanivorax sp. PN-3]